MLINPDSINIPNYPEIPHYESISNVSKKSFKPPIIKNEKF